MMLTANLHVVLWLRTRLHGVVFIHRDDFAFTFLFFRLFINLFTDAVHCSKV
jgi:hypothetical protein